MSLTRRSVLAGAACLATGSVGASTAAETDKPSRGELVESLGALAARRGLIFGSAYDVSAITIPAYGRLLKRHARMLTTDNSLKFGTLRYAGPNADFADADRVVAFGVESKLPVRGHNLIWNDWTPDWFWKETNARRAYWLDRHIEEVGGRYAGKLHSWDVVNEPIWLDHNKPGGLRDGPWYAAMGVSYVTRAFKRAQQADPNAKLAINEAGAEWASLRRDYFRTCFIDLIKRVQDAGCRLDIVGLECHWRPGLRFEPAVLEDFIARLGEMGLEVYFTEADVQTEKLPGSLSQVDLHVARYYAQLARVALKRREVKALITWELADSQSYMHEEAKRGFFKRKPRPLPFDEKFNPKLAYSALANTFREIGPRA